MLTVNNKFPNYSLKASLPQAWDKGEFSTINSDSYKDKWRVIFFWPKDFTFVCPTELIAFGRLEPEFSKRNAQLIGASTDSEFSHLAWRTHYPEIKDLPYPMLADIKRELSNELGILHPTEGVAQRATYIINPEGAICFVMVTDLSIGRNPIEVLRVLDAIQTVLKTGEFCPANWNVGDNTISV